MKQFLAVFIGKVEAMSNWRKLPEKDRKERDKAGMIAWQKWVEDHRGDIVVMGSPLGKTKRVNAGGVSDFKNELCAYTIVQAKSHDSAAEMFLNHPHFALFPGDSVEIVECMAIPAPKA